MSEYLDDNLLKLKISNALSLKYESPLLKNMIVGLGMCTYRLFEEDGKNPDECWDGTTKELEKQEKDVEKTNIHTKPPLEGEQDTLSNAIKIKELSDKIEKSGFTDEESILRLYMSIVGHMPRSTSTLISIEAFNVYVENIKKGKLDSKEAFICGLVTIGEALKKL